MNEEIESIKCQIISAGVDNLRKFGYPTANKKSIFKTLIFKKLFMQMLHDNKGQGSKVDNAIDQLIAKLTK